MNLQGKAYRISMFVTLTIVIYTFLPNLRLSSIADVGSSITHGEQMKLDRWQKQLCVRRNISMDIKNEADLVFDIPVIGRDIFPEESPKNVFLVETSCNPRPQFRDWCSVESWAKLNPTMPVWYIVTSPFLKDKFGLLRDLRTQYKNLNVVGCNMSMIMRKTPLKHVFESNKWFKHSPWPHVNLSDMVRYLLVWMFGGIYSDTDVICIKDTIPLSNVVGVEAGTKIGSAVFHGDPHNPVFWKLMEHVNINFKGRNWGTNGPAAVTHVVREQCNLSKVETYPLLPLSPKECKIQILPQYSFFPVPFKKFKEYFISKRQDLLKMYPNSYTIHFWNIMSVNTPIVKSSYSIMEEAAQRFCPITFNTATKFSNIF